jgi:hypothetical protein
MKKLDGKFYGVIVKNKNGALVPPDQWIVFLAKDNALPATLAFYEAECLRQGAEPAQVEAVGELRRRVDAWRTVNSRMCKTPDVEPGELA